MVMEAPHSAQLVGREFVRQYYTLLNCAPQYLHRFYSNNSSFIHGGLSNKDRDINPAIGQKEIHQKIQQLKFCDCHTRINQVDSQTTLGDGVVVQVTGEFSNAGNPMRRFTQTFVLAAQAPKTYYVHNDIFRYQDGFPHDEGDDIEAEANTNDVNESEADEVRSEVEDDDQVVHQTQNVPDQGHPGHITAQQQPIHTNQQPMYYAPPSQQVPIPLVINGTVHEESPLINQQLPQQPQTQPQQQQQQQCIEPIIQEQFTQEPETTATVEQSQQPQQTQSQQQQQLQAETPPDDDNNPPSDESHEQQQQQQQQQQLQQQPAENFQQQQPSTIESENDNHNQIANSNSNRPKSYARTVRSNAIGGSSQVPKSSMSPPPISNIRNDDRPMDIWNASSTHLTSNVMSSGQQHRMSNNQTSQPQQQQQQQQQQQPQQQQQQQQPSQQQQQHQQRDQQRDHQQQRQPRVGATQKDNRGRRDWPDNHQLFVGNVSHQAKDVELREIFEKFGRVVDMRIFSKSNDRGKPQGQNNPMRVPHYGFVTFEDATAVAKVLAAHTNKPICYPDEAGQKLNIEEKKNKPRTMGDNNMRSNQNDGNMRSSMGGQQQQQQRGPSGLIVMRGGQRGGRGFSRGDGGRGGMRQPGGNMGNPGYQHRR